MELDENSFPEEILAPRSGSDGWDPYSDFFSSSGADGTFCGASAIDGGGGGFHGIQAGLAGFDGINLSVDSLYGFDCLSEVCCPTFAVADEGWCHHLDALEFAGDSTGNVQSTCRSGDAGMAALGGDGGSPASLFIASERKKKKKKRAEGMPSKNLMAERRRRKRLNDRLSMLRSVVPKLSKMDRASILCDTIDYMKELLERIKCLREEIHVGQDHLPDLQLSNSFLGIFNDLHNPNALLVKNSPKVQVEKREGDMRIEIYCSLKPGLLFSTASALESMGLEIQQCVASCFNDFAMQASCSQEMEHKATMSCEEIKQVLFRNAGYGGS